MQGKDGVYQPLAAIVDDCLTEVAIEYTKHLGAIAYADGSIWNGREWLTAEDLVVFMQ